MGPIVLPVLELPIPPLGEAESTESISVKTIHVFSLSHEDSLVLVEAR